MAQVVPHRNKLCTQFCLITEGLEEGRTIYLTHLLNPPHLHTIITESLQHYWKDLSTPCWHNTRDEGSSAERSANSDINYHHCTVACYQSVLVRFNLRFSMSTSPVTKKSWQIRNRVHNSRRGFMCLILYVLLLLCILE